MLSDENLAYVLGRLDRYHVEAVADRVREQLAFGVPVEACYAPGDSTQYNLLFARDPMLVSAMGGGMAGGGPTSQFRNALFIVYYAQGNRGTGVYRDVDYVWAASKLIDNEASAVAIAELFKAIQKGVQR